MTAAFVEDRSTVGGTPTISRMAPVTVSSNGSFASSTMRATSAYLESSNERNLSFYRRCGFELLGEVEVHEGGPVMRPMRRSPCAEAPFLTD